MSVPTYNSETNMGRAITPIVYFENLEITNNLANRIFEFYCLGDVENPERARALLIEATTIQSRMIKIMSKVMPSDTNARVKLLNAQNRIAAQITLLKRIYYICTNFAVENYNAVVIVNCKPVFDIYDRDKVDWIDGSGLYYALGDDIGRFAVRAPKELQFWRQQSSKKYPCKENLLVSSMPISDHIWQERIIRYIIAGVKVWNADQHTSDQYDSDGLHPPFYNV